MQREEKEGRVGQGDQEAKSNRQAAHDPLADPSTPPFDAQSTTVLTTIPNLPSADTTEGECETLHAFFSLAPPAAAVGTFVAAPSPFGVVAPALLTPFAPPAPAPRPLPPRPLPLVDPPQSLPEPEPFAPGPAPSAGSETTTLGDALLIWRWVACDVAIALSSAAWSVNCQTRVPQIFERDQQVLRRVKITTTREGGEGTARRERTET